MHTVKAISINIVLTYTAVCIQNMIRAMEIVLSCVLLGTTANSYLCNVLQDNCSYTLLSMYLSMKHRANCWNTLYSLFIAKGKRENKRTDCSAPEKQFLNLVMRQCIYVTKR